MPSLDEKNYINLDGPVSPAVLAGILGISVSMVYQHRQEGRLPASPKSTYRENILSFILHYKRKEKLVKPTELVDRKLLQEIRNGIAKEEQIWLSIKKERSLLLDIQEFEPIIVQTLQLVRSSLVNISRQFPETQELIDGTIRSWHSLGEKLIEKAKLDADSFVAEKLATEIDLAIEGEEEDIDEDEGEIK